MIDDWLSEDGRKAISIMGWPKWKWGNSPYVLIWRLDAWQIGNPGSPDDRDPYSVFTMPEHIALCLLRDWAREWLDAREIEIHAVGDGHFMAWHRHLHCYLIRKGRFEALEMRDDAMFWGYDLALIHPVLAVEKAKE